MADLITLRILFFLGAFFALRWVMHRVIPAPKRMHGLAFMAIASLVAFMATALILDDSLPNALLAWTVIFGLLAVVFLLRWKSMDHEAALRDRELARREAEAHSAPDTDP